MYIGSSYKCTQYCEEEDKKKFDKYHSEHRHHIHQLHTFQEENRIFIRKSKKAWNNFAIKLESFFKKIKTQIQFIENEAKSRLEFEEVKTAINSNDKELTKITFDIMQERYRNLTCQDIYDFIKLRKQRQHQSQPIIDDEEADFAESIIKQLRDCFKDICEDFRPNKPPKYNDDYRHPRKEKQYRPQLDHNTRDSKNYQKREKPYVKKQKPRKYEDEESEEESRKSVRGSTRGEPRRGGYRHEQKRHEFRNRQEEPFYKKNIKQKEHRQPRSYNDPEDDRPRPLLKISDLTANSSAFDIELKLISCIKPLYNKEVWRASDETGEIKLVVPYHKYMQEGAKIRLKNCFVKSFVRSLEIYTKYGSRISCSNQKEEPLKGNVPLPEDRVYQHEEVEHPKERALIKINDIEPEQKNMKLIAKVLKVTSLDEKERRFKYVLGDETGIVNAEFEKFEALLREGSVVYLRGVESDVDSKGFMYLKGTKILIEPAHDSISSVNRDNNVSGRQYVQV